ncbi:unnamed protein product [Closterium sp. NIES-65]|nr:unnamed protein product [Closterium sp. NIES-65]
MSSGGRQAAVAPGSSDARGSSARQRRTGSGGARKQQHTGQRRRAGQRPRLSRDGARQQGRTGQRRRTGQRWHMGQQRGNARQQRRTRQGQHASSGGGAREEMIARMAAEVAVWMGLAGVLAGLVAWRVQKGFDDNRKAELDTWFAGRTRPLQQQFMSAADHFKAPPVTPSPSATITL